MKPYSLDEFYQQLTTATGAAPGAWLPAGIQREIGHFNVFDVATLFRSVQEKPHLPYDRRAYYKINLIRGRSRAEYANQVVEVERRALLFATPKVPYNWLPLDREQAGHFCIFTEEFVLPAKSGVVLDELPLFRAGGCPVFEIAAADAAEAEDIFQRMHREMAGSYAYKYDLLRTYTLELLHLGQKLQPAAAPAPGHAAAARVAGLFAELLERQFPLATPRQQLRLRTATDYADRLAVHVNHLNKVLKETTGRTTTELIAARVAQEAKLLLRQTSWSVAEIADSLGFREVAHFSNFFKRQTTLSPAAFRAGA
jgi:AraC-like DNA-binding protein